MRDPRGYRKQNDEISGNVASRQGVDKLLAPIAFRLGVVARGRSTFSLFKYVETQRFLCTCMWSCPLEVVSSGSRSGVPRKGRLRDRLPQTGHQTKANPLAYLLSIFITHESEVCSLRSSSPHAPIEINLQVA